MFLFFEEVILERETLGKEQPEKAKQNIRETDTNTVDNVKLRKTYDSVTLGNRNAGINPVLKTLKKASILSTGNVVKSWQFRKEKGSNGRGECTLK